MLHKTAIIKIRQCLGIPKEGFPSEDKALAWYREHYRQAKGKDFRGDFGFQYDRGYVNFKYEIGPNFIKIHTASPLDDAVPLDIEALTLAQEENIPDWGTPVLRLLILLGEPTEAIELHLPDHLMTPLGDLRVLVHPVTKLALRKWRKTGEMMGLLPGEIDLWKVPGIMTTYSPKRENKNEPLYWQTLSAYGDAIYQRRKIKKKGRRGLLVETAKILEKKYGWEYKPDSYTVRRYLDRAEKIWHISTKEWLEQSQ